jgi:hypothetical protein
MKLFAVDSITFSIDYNTGTCKRSIILTNPFRIIVIDIGPLLMTSHSFFTLKVIIESDEKN